MIHGVAFPISAGVLGLALLAGKLAQDGTAYFPRSLHEATVTCTWSNRTFGKAAMNDHRAAWYGSHLHAAGETPIFDSPTRTLRFTWLRTFHEPVIVRVDMPAGGAALITATELSGKGGYTPGGVARRVERRLSVEETASLARTLDETDALAQPPTGCELGADGAQWILESTGPGGYVFVDEWTPRDGPVRALGLHLIELTGWSYDRVY